MLNEGCDKTVEYRRKRVQRLKKILITTLIVMLITPLVLCTVIMIRLNQLEKQVKQLQEVQKGQEATSMEVEESISFPESITEDSIKASMGDSAETSVESATPPPSFQEERNEQRVKKVYLTFDDGPGPNTAELLDILSQYGVKATFFVTAMHGSRYEDSYAEILAGGHSIGLHSYSHKYSEIYASLENFQADFYKLQTYLYELTGKEIRIARFPGGSSNSVSAVPMRELIRWLEEEEIVYFDWNVSGQDTGSGEITSHEIVDNCIRGIEQKQEGSTVIVLLHDVSGSRRTLEALPFILEELGQMEDVVMLPIDEDTLPIQHINITNE